MNFNSKMQVACRNNPEDPEALKVLDVLFETAMISSGFTVSTLLFSISLTSLKRNSLRILAFVFLCEPMFIYIWKHGHGETISHLRPK